MPAYMHQGALIDAYKKLYMLGGPGHERRKAAEKGYDEAVSGAIGGIGDAYAQKLARDRAAMDKLKQQLAERKAQEAADAEQMDQDVRYIKEGPEGYREFQNVTAGNAVPTNPYREELARQAKEREAAATNIGGIYTPQGLQQADRESTMNAHDRLLMRSLVQPGLGGSSPQPIGAPPPDLMRGY